MVPSVELQISVQPRALRIQVVMDQYERCMPGVPPQIALILIRRHLTSKKYGNRDRASLALERCGT